MTVDERIGENLLRFRTAKGLSQHKMAVLIGVKGQTTYSMIESGRRKLTPEGILRIKKALGITLEELFR